MKLHEVTRLAAATGPAVLAGSAVVAAEPPKVDPAELDKAFETLKTFDWGSDPKTLSAIEQAVVATQGDPAGSTALERRLVAALGSDISRAAKDYVCRMLRTMGTADSVPVLAAMLPNRDLSHMARYALERIPATEAGTALREALAKTDGALKVGLIQSLGARGDATATPALTGLLDDSDAATVIAAATALGAIGTLQAAKALTGAVAKAPGAAKSAVIDACFRCAERLLADGKRGDAVAVYKSFTGEDQPKHVRLAATRGLLGQ